MYVDDSSQVKSAQVGRQVGRQEKIADAFYITVTATNSLSIRLTHCYQDVQSFKESNKTYM